MRIENNFKGQSVTEVISEIENSETVSEFLRSHSLTADVAEAIASIIVYNDPAWIIVTPSGGIYTQAELLELGHTLITSALSAPRDERLDHERIADALWDGNLPKVARLCGDRYPDTYTWIDQKLGGDAL